MIGNSDHKGAREDHVLQRTLGRDIDDRCIVRLLGPCHDCRVLELDADCIDNGLCGLGDCTDGEACKEEDEHGAEECPDKDVHVCQVDDIECLAGELGNVGHVGVEEQEYREGCTADGIPLGKCLGCVAGCIELVHAVPDFVRGLAHLDDTAGIVGDGAEGVHGKDVGTDHQHTDGCNGSTVEAAARDTGHGPAPVRDEEGNADEDCRNRGGLETDRESHNDVGSRPGLRGIGDILHRAVVVVGVVEGDPEEGYGKGNTHETCKDEVHPAGCCTEEVIDSASEEESRR